MSASIQTGKLGIRVLTGSGATDPQFRIDQNMTISATVDGFAASLSTDSWRAGEPVSLLVNGLQYIAAPGHGAELEWAHNLLPYPTLPTSQNLWCPTSDGRGKDGASVALSTSNCLERWVSADGRTMRTVIKAAFWCDVGETRATMVPLNDRPLSEMIGTTEHQWGFGGNDHIITRTHTLVIPSGDPIVNAMTSLVPIPTTLYSPDTAGTAFDTMQYLDMTTGVYSAYAGYPSASTTKAIVMSKADGTAAITIMAKMSEFGTGIGMQGYEVPVGNNSVFVVGREEPVGGIATIAGQTRTYHTAICLSYGAGALNNVKDAVLQLNAAWN